MKKLNRKSRERFLEKIIENYRSFSFQKFAKKVVRKTKKCPQ